MSSKIQLFLSANPLQFIHVYKLSHRKNRYCCKIIFFKMKTENPEMCIGISECLESELKLNSVMKRNYPLITKAKHCHSYFYFPINKSLLVQNDETRGNLLISSVDKINCI